MTLHIVSASPASGGAFDDCLRALGEGDVLLLTGDSVYAALPGTRAAAALSRVALSQRVYALADDCTLRGVTSLPAGVGTTDTDGFVALACEHARSVSWF